MNLYQFKYSGYYPVGACGVVLADNEIAASDLARRAIAENNQPIEGLVVTVLTYDVNREFSAVILDGNY